MKGLFIHAAFLGALMSVCACGHDYAQVVAAQPIYQGPTIQQKYEQCLDNNPYLSGSPMWRRWAYDCRVRYGLGE